MTTKIHNPHAILHNGKISLKYWDCERPELSSTLHGYIYHKEYQNWLASAKIVPFDNELRISLLLMKQNNISAVKLEEMLSPGIPLASIADRLEVKYIEINTPIAMTNKGVSSPEYAEFAIIHPVPAPNPYQDLVNLVASNYGKQMGEVIEIIKKQFKVEKR